MYYVLIKIAEIIVYKSIAAKQKLMTGEEKEAD
jgi:hypothetical protein